MSLGKTLLKVAIGVAVAKGMSALAKKGSAAPEAEPGRGTPYGKSGSGGLGDIMDSALGGKGSSSRNTGGGGGGFGDLLSEITGTGGSSRNADTGRGGFGDPLTEPGSEPQRRTPRRNAPSGGLEDLLGGLTGGATRGQTGGQIGGQTGGQSGGLGGLLEAILGGAVGGAAGGALAPQERETELAAALALRAMIQAVKADGALDAEEKRKLTAQLGDATREEMAFVQAELVAPVDIDGLARQVPNGMEEQVYTVSLMAINLDNQKEAQYLAGLAQALQLTPAEVNALHDRAGAPHIFR